MAEYLEGFIREMTIYPNMVTVAALPEMVEEFKKLLLLLPQSHPPQMLYYDTTFNMGDFYISTLLFSHGAFQERPTTPLAIMAHQTKDQKSHEAFFLQILHMLPELTSKRIVICTDREAAIENAIEKVLPTVPIVNCWNHLMQNVKHTVRGCGGTKEDVEVYQAHLNQLLSCISLTQYHTVKQDISSMCRDKVMKNKTNKRRLGELLCTHSIGDHIKMVSRADSIVTHDEADVSLISYMLDAARRGATTVHILSDDTDVFVLMVYWCWKVGITCHLQMERWDGTVLNINLTVENLGEQCRSILAMHALSGCDTTSYPAGKGKVSALKAMRVVPDDLLHFIGEEGATDLQITEAVRGFFLALYNQRKSASLNVARYDIYQKRKTPPALKTLPPTVRNAHLHGRRAYRCCFGKQQTALIHQLWTSTFFTCIISLFFEDII
ncbi:hypothetical protein SKAU_G00186590 [Synaphobranchus kaupii]|uniref:MULE transposase domain-containing protein n=1 Tax=Synaphobranchus kaupii TaxID=118154 RepID=A0A9Q1FD40_SYNKA|nr:hypothetical protein SKAU_G00186590 [Synaphobranchus kaupii]